jgi:hypothetical protein
MKRFYVSFSLEVDEDNNILSSCDEDHQEDMYDLISNLLHDVDDTEVHNLTVKERQ